MAAPIRAFLALQPPAEVRSSLSEALADIETGRVRVRPVGEDNIHLTLEFLGSIDTEFVRSLSQAMDEVGAESPPFDLFVDGIAAFPRKKPVVLAAEIDDQVALGRLVGVVRDRLTSIGFSPEDRPFRPHITLGRIKGGHRQARGICAPINLTFRATEILLFESTLTAAGAQYRRLHETKLSG